METLINAQLAQKEMMEKFIVNYKKDGKDKRTRSYYEKRLESFESMWDEFASRHKEILIQKYANKDIDVKKFEYFSKDIFLEMEAFFHNNSSLIQERFEKEYPPEQSEINMAQSTSKLYVKDNTSAVKLPKIYLEKFNGDYRKWPTFHDLFKTLVHENMSISPVQKLQYPKLHLSGEPEKLLRHFQVTDGNYLAAWNLLKDRYNNKRILVNTHLPLLSSESAQGVKGLLDTTTECLQALDNLDVETTNWDPLIVYLIVQRLPAETHQLWEQAISQTKELPSWKTLQEFLETRFRTLEAILSKKTFNAKDTRSQFNKSRSNTKSFHVAANISCVICLGNHSIRQCPTFTSYNSVKRMEIVKSKGLCINCLGSGHILVNCPSQMKCWHCKQRHHSLLHRKPNEKSQVVVPSRPNIGNNQIQHVTTNYNSYECNKSNGNSSMEPIQPLPSSNTLSATAPSFIADKVPSTSTNLSSFLVHKTPTEQVLLATAMVKVCSPTGQEQVVRALIDQGSQASFVTETVVQDLKLKGESINADIHGLGKGRVNHTNHRVTFTIKSLVNDVSIEVSGPVLKRLTDLLPTKNIPYHKWEQFADLELADPQFYKPGRINLLLGADIYSQIILNGLRKSMSGSPIAQKTSLGWILSGEISMQREPSIILQNFHVHAELDEQLKRFWELEEIHEASVFSPEEDQCEKHFKETVRRLSNGRYEVEMPLREVSESQHL